EEKEVTVATMASSKPNILYFGRPIHQVTPLWNRLQENCNILFYDLDSDEELLAAFGPDGKYSHIDGIMRPSNTDVRNLPTLTKEVISHLPPNMKIIASTNHGYEDEDTEELARRGIWYFTSAGGASDSTADIAIFLIIGAFRLTTYCENEL